MLNAAEVIRCTFYIIVSVLLYSCRTDETTAFWFKNEENKRTGNIKRETNNLEITLSSIISTDQVYQGMNTNLDLRAINNQKVVIDSIAVMAEIQNELVTPIVSESWAKIIVIKYPITFEPNEFNQYSILLPNQEDYKIEIGDTLSLKIVIYQTEQLGKTALSFEAKKYFETREYEIMP